MQERTLLNRYLINLRPYKPVSQEIWSLPSEEWNNVLKLDWNESTIEPAPAVKKAVIDFVKQSSFLHTLLHLFCITNTAFCPPYQLYKRSPSSFQWQLMKFPLYMENI